MGQILVRESFLVESMSMPNFMKIRRGQDFFFAELVWNDPYPTLLYEYHIKLTPPIHYFSC